MNAPQTCFEDVAIGQSISALTVGPLTSAHLVRWCGASENWHKIHYDKTFAIEHDGLPERLINGSLKQQFLVKLVKDWAGSQGWAWKVSFQFRAMNIVGERLTSWGTITEITRANGFGLVHLDLGIRNQDGQESTPGKAVVALPYRDGPAVPYPFVAPRL